LSGDNYYSGTLNYCCTTPLPGGNGNLTNAPLFINWTNGNLRLLPNSPCIDAGTNLIAFVTNDLAGLPRPLDGNGDGVAAFDIGAYEFDLRSIVPTNWFQQYNLNSADLNMLADDPDRDGHTTFQEWLAGTDPTNALSCFRIENLSPGPPLAVSFASLTNRVYSLLACTNLSAQSWNPLHAGIPGLGGWQTLTDTNAPSGVRFYRLKVSLP
jgi:hypothetical protein